MKCVCNSFHPIKTTRVLTYGIFSIILFAGDLILNIDNPATEIIPIGQRIALAFLSAAAVRSAGFQGVAVSSLVPAVQYVSLVVCFDTFSDMSIITQSVICCDDVYRNIPPRHEVTIFLQGLCEKE